jgi:hypothetical protein
MANHMTKHEAEKELFRIADRLDMATSGNPFEAAHGMRYEAMQLDALNLRECNGVIGPDGFAKWDDQDQARNDRLRANSIARFKALMIDTFPGDIELLTRYEFQGDPRGPSIRVYGLDGQALATFW